MKLFGWNKLPVICLVWLMAVIGTVMSNTSHKSVARESRSAKDQITVHAAGRGSPWINLRDGVDLPTGYAGPDGLRQALEQNQAVPLALAAGDFDEDGVPDLVSGYIGLAGGIVTLHRGNVDSIFPNSSEAQRRKADGKFTDLPFLTPTRIFEVPEAPEFLGTGDFDADGHWDIVTAASGSDALYWLPGDGRGGFGSTKSIKLPGTMTALVTGEINRADGLTDVVVGIIGPDGSEVLVFEWPEGALQGEPEASALPAEVTALALGQLDESYEMDLAVAAGSELLIVHGRDRRLSLDEIRRAEVPPATTDQLSFSFAIASMALGDFVWDTDHRTEIALLSADGQVHLLERKTAEAPRQGENGTWQINSVVNVVEASPLRVSASQRLLIRAKVSSLPTDDLVVIDSANHQLHILNAGHESGTNDKGLITKDHGHARAVALDTDGAVVAVSPMRLNVDALSDLVILTSSPSAPT